VKEIPPMNFFYVEFPSLKNPFKGGRERWIEINAGRYLSLYRNV
jgi:hypothetical protein